MVTGDNQRLIKIGQLCTPIGVIHLSVCYRTKMTISPTQTGRDSIMLKSDHFHSDLSPRCDGFQLRLVLKMFLVYISFKNSFLKNKFIFINFSATMNQNH